MEGFSFRFPKHPVPHFIPAIDGNSTFWKVFKTLSTMLELRFNFVFCSHWICKYYSGYSLLFPWGREGERLLVFVRPAVFCSPADNKKKWCPASADLYSPVLSFVPSSYFWQLRSMANLCLCVSDTVLQKKKRMHQRIKQYRGKKENRRFFFFKRMGVEDGKSSGFPLFVEQLPLFPHPNPPTHSWHVKEIQIL